jgi:ATP-binding cassette subfamily B protein/ATP-binding cassette subfamily C protein
VSAMINIQKIKLEKGLQGIVNQNIMDMDYENTEDPAFLDLREQAMYAINHRDFFYRLLNNMIGFITETINLISLGILISILNPLLIAVLLLICAINSFFNAKQKESNFFWDNTFNVFARRLGYFHSITNDFSTGGDSRIYNIKELLNEEFDYFNDKSYETNIRAMKKSGLYHGLISINEQMQLLAIYIYIAYKVFTGAIGIGDFVMYVNAASQFGKSMFNMMNNFGDFRFISQYLDIYKKLLNVEKTKKAESKKTLDTDEIHIEFRDVSFKYPRAEQYTLKNISVKINPREKLAVIGENGAGKTTFIKLLCGLYKPTSGEILINGVNISEYGYESYIQKISAVFQDFKILACSIKENVAFDNCGSGEKIREALAKSGIFEKTKTLPGGIDTQIYKYFDEDGIELSGGENQKLAISRAIYKDSPIIVLDEPTASLDPYAEHEIFCRLNEISENKTVIFISHRLSSCKICDKVIVFDKGEIVQQGAHIDLMRSRNSKYREMYSAQAKYYV